MPISKFQTQVKERLLMLLKGYEYQENYRPDWLINPETGRRLEIDIWLPDVKIGIEVQGAQHTRFIPGLHRDQSDFEKQKARDDYKRALCQKRGVYLYEVYSIDAIDNFLESAQEHHPNMFYHLRSKNTSLKALSYYAAEAYREMHKRRGKDRQKIQGLFQKMKHICDKYNWRMEDIKPDLTIRKAQMAFANKHMVKIEQVGNDERGNRHERAALMRIKDGVVTVRWAQNWGGHQDIDFDLETGKQIPETPKGWILKLDSLPETIWGSADNN